MNLGAIKNGMRVRTNENLGETNGMIVAQKNLDARQPRKEGEVTGHVPVHGGDVWWVKHDDGTVGAYCFDEFEAT